MTYKKSIGHFQQSTVNRYKAVKAYHSQFSVKKMCQVLSVSESGYYRWHRNPESKRAKEERELVSRIKEIL